MRGLITSRIPGGRRLEESSFRGLNRCCQCIFKVDGISGADRLSVSVFYHERIRNSLQPRGFFETLYEPYLRQDPLVRYGDILLAVTVQSFLKADTARTTPLEPTGPDLATTSINSTEKGHIGKSEAVQTQPASMQHVGIRFPALEYRPYLYNCRVLWGYWENCPKLGMPRNEIMGRMLLPSSKPSIRNCVAVTRLFMHLSGLYRDGKVIFYYQESTLLGLATSSDTRWYLDFYAYDARSDKEWISVSLCGSGNIFEGAYESFRDRHPRLLLKGILVNTMFAQMIVNDSCRLSINFGPRIRASH
ncbi:hypothetical protein M752DRAFT_314708 [Aspergillus phoenicis ATCC 13157]|uniref:Uncharacterized protein n=1 Tax=Aspergillus phoenicis ATCC 13157 TaxID=1353007 RepID=A0A370PMS4_ASPPH|nr:hypothetical protein M752DRAFT_314708 [Aspergillus phoenicis ATCC 13157]